MPSGPPGAPTSGEHLLLCIVSCITTCGLASSHILASTAEPVCRLHRLLFVSAMPRVDKQFDELRLEAVLYHDLGEEAVMPNCFCRAPMSSPSVMAAAAACDQVDVLLCSDFTTYHGGLRQYHPSDF